MGGRGHGGHVTNLPILKRENCTSLRAGNDNRVSYAFTVSDEIQPLRFSFVWEVALKQAVDGFDKSRLGICW